MTLYLNEPRYTQKQTNPVRYERGHLSTEQRLEIEEISKRAHNQRYSARELQDTLAITPTSINALVNDPTAPIEAVMKIQCNFQKDFPQFSWRDPSILHDRFINDARVVPFIQELHIAVNDIYSQKIIQNLNAIYTNAPRFFAENFFFKTSSNFTSTVNNSRFEAYQQYIYVLCYIVYVSERFMLPEFQRIPNIEAVIQWVISRRSSSYQYIIDGPRSNTDIMGLDFVEQYRVLISPSNNMSDIISSNQLQTQQTISTDTLNILQFLQTNPNVFSKTADIAKKYILNINSVKNVRVETDKHNNLIFNMDEVSLGNVSEEGTIPNYDELHKLEVKTDGARPSISNSRKLADLFHNYTRFSISELIISPDAYITSLDIFPKVFIVFNGIFCGERTVYNDVSEGNLKIGGHFKRTNRGFEFIQDSDAITYRPAQVDVKKFEMYITTDPSKDNAIIPNEFVISFEKNKIFQHPLKINYNPEAIPLKLNTLVETDVREFTYVDTTDATVSVEMNSETIKNITGGVLESLVQMGTDVPGDDVKKPVYEQKYDSVMDFLKTLASEEIIPSRDMNQDGILIIDSQARAMLEFIQTHKKFYTKHVLNMIDMKKFIKVMHPFCISRGNLVTDFENIYKFHPNIIVNTHLNYLLTYLGADKNISDTFDEFILCTHNVKSYFDKLQSDAIPQSEWNIHEIRMLIYDFFQAHISIIRAYTYSNNLTANIIKHIIPEIIEGMYKLITCLSDGESAHTLEFCDLTLAEEESNYAIKHEAIDMIDINNGFTESSAKSYLLKLTENVSDTTGLKSGLQLCIQSTNKVYESNQVSVVDMKDSVSMINMEVLYGACRVLREGQIHFNRYIKENVSEICAIISRLNVITSELFKDIAERADDFEVLSSYTEPITTWLERYSIRSNIEEDIDTHAFQDSYAEIMKISIIAGYAANILVYTNAFISECLLLSYNLKLFMLASKDESISRSLSVDVNDPTQIIPRVSERAIHRTSIYEPVFTQMTVVVDTVNGTINGKRFKQLSDGKIMFNEYSSDNTSYSPVKEVDYRYTTYPDNLNDLMLFNLYTVPSASANSSELMKNIKYGSFLISEQFKSIMNMSYVLTDPVKARNLLRFNNSFSVLLNRDGNSTWKHYTNAEWDDLSNMLLEKSGPSNIFNITIPESFDFTISNGIAESTYNFMDEPHKLYKKQIVEETIDQFGNILQKISEINEYIMFNVYTGTSSRSSDKMSDLGTFIDSYIESFSITPISNNVIIKDTVKTTCTYYSIDIGLTDVRMYYSYYDPIVYYSAEDERLTYKLDNVKAPEVEINRNLLKTVSINEGIMVIEGVDKAVNLQRVNLGTHSFNIATGTKNYRGYINVIPVQSCKHEVSHNNTVLVYGTITESTDLDLVFSNNYITFSGTACGLVYDEMQKSYNSNIFDIITQNSGMFGIMNTENAQNTCNAVLKLTDTFGNDTSINNFSKDTTFVNNMFSSIEDLVGTTFTQAGKDTSNNDVYTAYAYDRYLKLLTIKAYTDVAVSSIELHDDIYVDMSTDDFKYVLYKYNLNKTTGKISNVDVRCLMIVESTESDGTNSGYNRIIVNTEVLQKLTAFNSSVNKNYSNMFNAYNYAGVDFVNNWWNRMMYVQSALLCEIPVNKNNMYHTAIIPRESVESKREIKLETSHDSNLVLYRYDSTGVLKRLYGEYVINNEGVFAVSKGITKPIDFDSIYAYNGGILMYNNTDDTSLYWYSESRGVDVDEVKKEIPLYDENAKVQYVLEFCVKRSGDSARVDSIKIFERKTLYETEEEGKINVGTADVLIKEYTGAVISNVPVYIDDMVLLVTYELEVMSTEKRMIVSEVSIATVEVKCKEYLYEKPSKSNRYESRVLERDVRVMRYSNIPGEFITNSGALMDGLFALRVPADTTYMFHSRVKYVENAFVNPKYTTKTGKYLTVVEKTNKNIITSNVILRNEYSIGSGITSMNIAPGIHSETEHIMESVNKDFIVLGNVNKHSPLSEIAIESDRVNIIPLSSKMIVSMEFT